MIVVFDEGAVTDLEVAQEWYETKRLGLGDKLEAEGMQLSMSFAEIHWRGPSGPTYRAVDSFADSSSSVFLTHWHT